MKNKQYKLANGKTKEGPTIEEIALRIPQEYRAKLIQEFKKAVSSGRKIRVYSDGCGTYSTTATLDNSNKSRISTQTSSWLLVSVVVRTSSLTKAFL
jgi:hypothetical protein